MSRNTPVFYSPSSQFHDASINRDAPRKVSRGTTERWNLKSYDFDTDELGVSREQVKQKFQQLLESTCAIPSQLSLEPHGQCLLGHKWRLDSVQSIPIAFFAVFFITLTFEYLRVLAKRLDNHIIARALRRSLDSPPPPPKKICPNPDCPYQQGQSPQPDEKIRRGTGLLKYPDIESGRKGYYVTETKLQLVRALLYMLITMVGYMLVLFVVMTLNVMVILAILLGAAVGKFFTDWLKFDIVLSKSEASPSPAAAVGEGVQTRGDREATAGRYA